MTDFGFETTLSHERFARYLQWAEGDHVRALELYALNTQLSEALYTPLQLLEVTLRNRIHTVLTDSLGECWLSGEGFLVLERQHFQLEKARRDLLDVGREPTPGRIVAALTFSFWGFMLSPKYEVLWQTTLHRIAQREDGRGLRRKDLAAPMAPIRMLRNRVAHHEAIIHWDLPAHHANILQLTCWLSPAAGTWGKRHSRFPEVYPDGGIALMR